MKRPYLASRNHSSLFSLAGSTRADAWLGPTGASAPTPAARASRTHVSVPPARHAKAARAATVLFMIVSESQTHRELHDARRPRRAGDADRRPEVRVDLRPGRVEARRPIDVLELDLVEQIVDLGAELRRFA